MKPISLNEVDEGGLFYLHKSGRGGALKKDAVKNDMVRAMFVSSGNQGAIDLSVHNKVYVKEYKSASVDLDANNSIQLEEESGSDYDLGIKLNDGPHVPLTNNEARKLALELLNFTDEIK